MIPFIFGYSYSLGRGHYFLSYTKKVSKILCCGYSKLVSGDAGTNAKGISSIAQNVPKYWDILEV
jgi:hypothetical protein